MKFDDHMINPTRILVKNQRKKNSKGKRKNVDESALKVVYISSPMKVKTSASRFRSLVQELTGKDSDISQYMDENNHNNHTRDFHHEIDCDHDQASDDRINDNDHHDKLLTSNVSLDDDTPTSSDYSFGAGPMDDSLFISQMKDQLVFEGIFSSNSFYDPSEMDVLGSFDELL